MSYLILVVAFVIFMMGWYLVRFAKRGHWTKRVSVGLVVGLFCLSSGCLVLFFLLGHLMGQSLGSQPLLLPAITFLAEFGSIGVRQQSPFIVQLNFGQRISSYRLLELRTAYFFTACITARKIPEMSKLNGTGSTNLEFVTHDIQIGRRVSHVNLFGVM